MDQALALSISIPMFALGAVALLPSVLLSSSLSERLLDRELKARQRLIKAALDQLRDLRVRLDDVFRDYDAGEDPFLRRVNSDGVLEPAKEYVRLTSLQNRMAIALASAQRVARLCFWFLGGFVLLSLFVIVEGILFEWVGATWISFTMFAGLLVLVVGGSIFAYVLVQIRRIDLAHVEVSKLTREDPDPTADAGAS